MKLPKIYFAYGSNLNIDQMMRRCPGAKPMSTAKLDGWKLLFSRGVLTIERSKGDAVYGAIYKVTKSDIKALHRYEGYPHLYDCITFKNGIFAYRMNEVSVSPPSDYYYEAVKQGFYDWGLNDEHLYKALSESLGDANSVAL